MATWQVGSSPIAQSIIGYLMPMNEGQPIVMSLPDLPDDKFVALFSTETKLRGMMVMWHTSYDGYTRIIDPKDFLDSILEARQQGNLIRVMIDPVATERNTTRFKEVVL